MHGNQDLDLNSSIVYWSFMETAEVKIYIYRVEESIARSRTHLKNSLTLLESTLSLTQSSLFKSSS
jgi:hypothetical protein